MISGLAEKKRYKLLRSQENKDTKGVIFLTAEELKVGSRFLLFSHSVFLDESGLRLTYILLANRVISSPSHTVQFFFHSFVAHLIFFSGRKLSEFEVYLLTRPFLVCQHIPTADCSYFVQVTILPPFGRYQVIFTK
jgi:hypothetical protein